MARLLDFTKYDKDAPGAEVDEGQARELRRLANLFLISAVTLVLLFMLALAQGLALTFIPEGVYYAWYIALLAGWVLTLVYGVFVTFAVRRWGWLALCAIPLTCVPAAVAYAWIRRQEIEHQVLGDTPAAAARQRRGGRRHRR
jgi:hypothetical protein